MNQSISLVITTMLYPFSVRVHLWVLYLVVPGSTALVVPVLFWPWVASPCALTGLMHTEQCQAETEMPRGEGEGINKGLKGTNLWLNLRQ